MALTRKQLNDFRKEIQTTYRPIYFFDDDPDGLASFLLLYRFIREGKGVVVKARPILEPMYARKVKEYRPDKIFVLDKPDISQEFLDKVKTKIVWLDHHEPKQKPNIHYFNPMMNDKKDNRPTSYWCYRIVKNDLWMAMVGIVGDWYLPKIARRFSKKYPDLLPSKVKRPEIALYDTKLGKLIRIFSFVLKGRTNTVNECIKVLTSLNTPYEILDQETAQGKFIYKNFQKLDKRYQVLLNKAVKLGTKKGRLLVFTYSDAKISFTGDLANELLYRFPKKIIIVARKKGNEMKSSLRSSKKPILPILKKALTHVEGYGGGHSLACGACIKNTDWQRFIQKFNSLL